MSKVLRPRLVPRKARRRTWKTSTLQKHLTRGEQLDSGKRLYVLDESSLASTRQLLNSFTGSSPMTVSCSSVTVGSMRR